VHTTIAGKLLGNTPYSQGGDGTHNCHWTLQARIYVQSQANQSISITGNDDIWMYVNGEVSGVPCMLLQSTRFVGM